MLSGTLKVALSLLETKVADLATASTPLSKDYSWKLANGTGASQADKIFHDQRTLGAGANEDIDLAGVLTDIYGAALTFARLKGLLIKAAPTNPNNLTVGRGATNGVPWISAVSAGVIVRPGGLNLWWAEEATGIVVTAGTGDLINVLAGAGGNHVYDVVIIGASA
jgi:hypothetical protein